MPENNTKIIPIDINEEMKKSFLDYSMSVIVSRALPDVRDGLKPVHRRILYAMNELGMTPDKPHKKSAHPVGEVLSKYHPHGDAAVYEAMVRMAQDFSTRYPLVDGHGNFGSIDGDSAAAMRYTEVRMAKITLEMLADINKDTVDFRPNYDESLEEPTVLPARIPNLLVNGSAGIAVGMATNIPPHNLGEVVDALVMLIEDPTVELSQLIKKIKGPDFPTGGIIVGRDGIISAYGTGRGSITVRAKCHVEKTSNGKQVILVTELPYQVNKARLIEKIAELVRERKIDGITDLRDESDRSGMRIVIELRRDANPQVILNQLYQHTQMQDTFGVIMLALVDGAPRILNLKEVLHHYIDHRKQVITRRTRFDLNKAEERMHIVEGLRIALAYLDEVIQTIRRSQTPEIAKNALMERFGLSDKQAQAILDMRLQRLTGLEREKLEEEFQELTKTINYLRSVLAEENLVLGIIKEELLKVKEQFADPRRTQIVEESTKLEIEDLIPEEDMVITITHQGYIKRMPVNTYRSQRRGGRGIVAMTTKEEDFVEHLFVTTTHHYLLFFTNRGRVYRLKVYEIPEASRQAKGTSMVNLLAIGGEDKINAVIPVREFVDDKYLFMATRCGVVKKTELSEYDSSRRDGIIAINLDENDELIGVKLTDGTEEIILGTRQGMAIRFAETDVRSMGRTARGVKGITLKPNDLVVSMDTVRNDADLLVVTENGFGKRTPLTDYRKQSRGGKGIMTIRTTKRNGSLVSIKVVKTGDELMIISGEGIIIRLNVEDISQMGRATQGITLMRLDPKDKVVAVAKVVSKNGEEDKNL
ncbi:MAG: DNA gyrase subunit A [Firmicutes bacterium]|nr:DNA gyrase subunit A [Bacillota bacterium]